MQFYDRIDVFEGIDINKTSTSKECDICCYWYFLNKVFKSQPYVCNRCYDLLMMPINLSNIDILKTKNADYCCIISGIGKSEAIILIWLKKVEHYKEINIKSNFEVINLLEMLILNKESGRL